MPKRAPKQPDGKPEAAGQRIFKVAADMFYREGIRSVGVETIVQKAGVAKISLYRAYKSKDDLIVAYLEDRNASYWRQLDELLARHEGEPLRQLDTLFEYVARRTSASGYRGCPFINYAAEFPDASHPGHRVVAQNKREMRRRLTALLDAAGVAEPVKVADAVFLLIEGAYAASQTLGGRSGPAHAVAWAARALVESRLGGGE